MAKSNSYEDAAMSSIYNAIPYLNAVQGIGGIAGLVEPPTGKDALKQLNENSDITRLLPGVSAARVNKRLTNTHKHYGAKSPRLKAFNQVIGPSTQTLLSALAGGVIGSMVVPVAVRKGTEMGAFDKDSDMPSENTLRAGGFMLGSAVGAGASGLAHLVGALAAGMSKTRTPEEQAKASNRSSLGHYLVPGYGMYDYYKTLGHSNTIGSSQKDDMKDKLKLAEKAKQMADATGRIVVLDRSGNVKHKF